MNAPKPWNGKDLKGLWHATVKIDGVRALWYGNVLEHPVGWFSRADKPLYNVPAPYTDVGTGRMYPGVDCELYLGSLKDSVRACRTLHLKPDTPRIGREHLYSLDPLDPRLDLGHHTDLTAADILELLASVNKVGFEGLVLRQGDRWLKVKPHDNYDVRILSMHEGVGKFKGTLGYIVTHMGKVGSFSITDAERMTLWNQRTRLVGATIEVECMQLTPDGKFRHARFIRERFDKIADK